MQLADLNTVVDRKSGPLFLSFICEKLHVLFFSDRRNQGEETMRIEKVGLLSVLGIWKSKQPELGCSKGSG